MRLDIKMALFSTLLDTRQGHRTGRPQSADQRQQRVGPQPAGS